jgi:hypothetical protein
MDQSRADGEMGTNDNISPSPPTSPPTENGTGTPTKRFGPTKRGRDNDTPAFAPGTPTLKISRLVDHYSSAAMRFAMQDVQGIPELPSLHQSIANIVDSIRRRNTSLRLNELSVFDKAITHLYRDQDDKVAALLLFVAEYSGIINGANPFEKCDIAAQKLAQRGAIKGLNSRIQMPSSLTDIPQKNQKSPPEERPAMVLPSLLRQRPHIPARETWEGTLLNSQGLLFSRPRMVLVWRVLLHPGSPLSRLVSARPKLHLPKLRLPRLRPARLMGSRLRASQRTFGLPRAVCQNPCLPLQAMETVMALRTRTLTLVCSTHRAPTCQCMVCSTATMALGSHRDGLQMATLEVVPSDDHVAPSLLF